MHKFFALLTANLLLAACAASGASTDSVPLEPKRSIAAVVIGGSDGGGGDTLRPWAGSAWFLGERATITACVQAAPGFSVREDDLKATVVRAFKVWEDFIEDRWGAKSHAGNKVDIARRVTFTPACSGREDLTFYFGVKDRAVNKALRDYEDPIAIAHRNSFATFIWDSGFIWVADDANAQRLIGKTWATSDLLLGALVHEIGHVLGCGHVAGTAMRNDVIDFLRAAGKRTPATRKVMMTSIDWTDVLLPFGFKFDFAGAVPYQSGDKSYSEWFEEIMGRKPVGTMRSRLWRKDDEFHLVFGDDAGMNDFVMEDWGGTTIVQRQKTVFKTYRPPGSGTTQPNFGDLWMDVMISRFRIQTANGKKARVQLQRGGGMDGAWEVTYFPLKSGEWTVFAMLPGGIPKDSP